MSGSALFLSNPGSLWCESVSCLPEWPQDPFAEDEEDFMYDDEPYGNIVPIMWRPLFTDPMIGRKRILTWPLKTNPLLGNPFWFDWAFLRYKPSRNNPVYMRHFEILVIKLCQVKIKLIALGWYWVTMIFCCQTNPEIHCSPTMHDVQDMWRLCQFSFIFGAVFLDNLCLYS